MNQLRAELLKIRSTRTTLGFLLGMIALVLLFTLLAGLLSRADSLANEGDQFDMLASAHISVLFAVLIGVMLMTTEYRHGTIRPTLLYEPRRGLVTGAKLAAGMLAGLVLGLVAETIAIAVGLLILSARGIDCLLGGGDLLRLVLAVAAVCALWAAIGVGVGAIVRHQVGAIVGVLAYIFVVDNLVFGLAPRVGRYLPGQAGQALIGHGSDQLVSPAAGGLLLVLYVLLLGAAGAALTARRDVG